MVNINNYENMMHDYEKKFQATFKHDVANGEWVFLCNEGAELNSFHLDDILKIIQFLNQYNNG